MAQSRVNLPNLPGYYTSFPIGKEYFGKKQNFSLMNKTCVLVQKQTGYEVPTLYSRNTTPDLPAWLLFDKKVLRFHGHILPSSEDWVDSLFIVRKIKITFYLEDGTMKVCEVKSDNSGLFQGTIVKRQRIPLPNNENQYYEINDLNIGNEVTFFGKRFLITDCDNFTRNHLNKLGIRVPDALNTPCEAVKHHRQKYSSRERTKSAAQFFEFDKRVLRFSAFWDDRDSECGYLHHLILFYYLADDTVEIKEIFNPFTHPKREQVFLNRGALPKNGSQCYSSFGMETENYSPSDLLIGSPINVYGRMIILTDCDQFTKEFYKTKFGIDHFDEITPPESLVTMPSSTKLPELPPWNGYGAHDDSAGNCFTMLPKAPKKDFYKFMIKDRMGTESNILRFTARLVTNFPEQDIRKFILSYYLIDDTILVYEIAVRNSGYEGGRFNRRAKILLPGQDLYLTNILKYYTPKDMWVGNSLIINDHKFLLTGTDEYTLKYMDKNYDEFPKANINLILDKIIKKLLSYENGYKDFVAKNLDVTMDDSKKLMAKFQFEQALKEIMDDILTEQEYITLIRYFKEKSETTKTPQRHIIRSLVFTDINRHLWQDYNKLTQYFKYLDENETGKLSRQQLRQALKAACLPIKNDLLDQLIDVIKKDEAGMYYYDDVLQFLDFKSQPAQQITPYSAKSTKITQNVLSLKFEEEEHAFKDELINWDNFIASLNLDSELKTD